MQKKIRLINFKELLESVLRRALKKSFKTRKRVKRIDLVKEREIKRIEFIVKELNKKINEMVKSFPSIDELHSFYKELIEIKINLIELKKRISQLQSLGKIISRIGFNGIKRIRKAENSEMILKAKKEFFGRLFSLQRDLIKVLRVLNEVAIELNDAPKIDFNAPVIILAGFPNTGKTTILERLTFSKAKIASYPFTTQRIELGTLKFNHHTIQVLDTPGLLDKSMEKRNKIERKALSALKHLKGVIVFVFDASMHCGYSIEKQKKLFNEIKKIGLPVIALINKEDIASKEELLNAIKIVKEKAIITGKGKEKELRAEIVKQVMKLL
jgi:nucleolar GTP-binding protein